MHGELMHRVGIIATFRRFKGEGRAGIGGCTGSGIVLSLAIQAEFSLPIVGSCRCRRGLHGTRTMNLIGLKPKPTLTPPLSRRAGEGESSPRPCGERGRGEGAVVMATNVGEIRVHAKISSHQSEARH